MQQCLSPIESAHALYSQDELAFSAVVATSSGDSNRGTRLRSYSNNQLAIHLDRYDDFERDGLTHPSTCGTHSFFLRT
jgi:hypothetical protein